MINKQQSNFPNTTLTKYCVGTKLSCLSLCWQQLGFWIVKRQTCSGRCSNVTQDMSLLEVHMKNKMLMWIRSFCVNVQQSITLWRSMRRSAWTELKMIKTCTQLIKIQSQCVNVCKCVQITNQNFFHTINKSWTLSQYMQSLELQGGQTVLIIDVQCSAEKML